MPVCAGIGGSPFTLSTPGALYFRLMNRSPIPSRTDLDKNPANYAPLTPLSFIERTAYVYPKRIAVIHGARRYTWAGDLRALPAPRFGAGEARASAPATRWR